MNFQFEIRKNQAACNSNLVNDWYNKWCRISLQHRSFDLSNIKTLITFKLND